MPIKQLSLFYNGGNMKKSALFLSSIFAFTAIMMTAFSTTASAAPFMSPSFGGATGYISTPSAKTGWSGSPFAVDLGYHYTGAGNGSHIPKATFQIFSKIELGIAMDFQDRHTDDDDMIIHGKFNFYNAGASSLAIGGNLQFIDMGNDGTDGGKEQTAGQLYLAVTYSSKFFGMPALTTMVLGKTFVEDHNDSNIDFSMGFDLDFLPQYLKGYVHWISDFANYSYSIEANGANAWSRACFNTGFRFAVLKDSRFKLNIDLIMTDALDTNRSWALGAAFGFAF